MKGSEQSFFGGGGGHPGSAHLVLIEVSEFVDVARQHEERVTRRRAHDGVSVQTGGRVRAQE